MTKFNEVNFSNFQKKSYVQKSNDPGRLSHNHLLIPKKEPSFYHINKNIKKSSVTVNNINVDMVMNLQEDISIFSKTLPKNSSVKAKKFSREKFSEEFSPTLYNLSSMDVDRYYTKPYKKESAIVNFTPEKSKEKLHLLKDSSDEEFQEKKPVSSFF